MPSGATLFRCELCDMSGTKYIRTNVKANGKYYHVEIYYECNCPPRKEYYMCDDDDDGSVMLNNRECYSCMADARRTV
jgi:hypothetical protein